MNQRTALVVIDVQYDFLPGGALGVAGADAIVAPLAALMQAKPCGLLVATQDWHAADHISFASQHPGREAFDRISLYGHEQVLWPDHCVSGSDGARLERRLPLDLVDLIIRKGADAAVDSYSAFRSNWNANGVRPTTGLGALLKDCGIESVYLCGLARDYCVNWSARDANAQGFETSVIWDLTRSVDPGTDDQLREQWRELGIKTVESPALIRKP